MHNRIFKSLISWLLIASPLCWTSGCYALREITQLEEAEAIGGQIEVTTKRSDAYTFDKWKIDSLGNVKGRAKRKNPSYKVSHKWDESGFVRDEPEFLEGPHSVPKDSVEAIRAEYLNVPLTILAGAGATIGAAVFVSVVIFVASPKPELAPSFPSIWRSQ